MSLADYVTPDLLQAAQDYGDLLLIAITVVGAIAATGKFLVFNPLRREIAEATSQVKKDANGGQSLNDLHNRVEGLETGQADIREDISEVKDDVKKIYLYLLEDKKGNDHA